MSEWLELELAHRLAPVAAPDDLWARIQKGQPAPERHAARWPIAAILTLGVAAATLWLAARGQEPPVNLTNVNLERLAMEQLHTDTPLNLRSSDPAQIAEWSRQHAGVTVKLPERGQARLAGVRLIRRGGIRMVAVDYSVGGDTATLLVARSAAGPESGHGRMSWTSGELSYALACSNLDHPEAACLLCHSSL